MSAHRTHRQHVPGRLLAAAALCGVVLAACAGCSDGETPPDEPDSQDLLPTEDA